MTLVWLAMIAISLVTVLNLILNVGLVRRLREHTEKLDTFQSRDIQIAAPKGDTIPYVPALDTAGNAITPESFASTQWAFFSEDCPACREAMGEYARDARSGVSDIAVIVGTGKASDEMVAQVLGVGIRATREGLGGSLQKAFSVSGFPAFIELDNGIVQYSGFRPNA